jgi:hypothetical protein
MNMNEADLFGTYWKCDLSEWEESSGDHMLYFKYKGPHSTQHQHLLLGCEGRVSYTTSEDLNTLLTLVTDPDEKGMLALKFLDIEDPMITWNNAKHIARRP